MDGWGGVKPRAEGREAVQSRAAAGQGQGGCRRRWSCGGWEAGGQALLGMDAGVVRSDGLGSGGEWDTEQGANGPGMEG